MEDDLKKQWKTNQSTKINLIGCDTIVNSPSFSYQWQHPTGVVFWHVCSLWAGSVECLTFLYYCLFITMPGQITAFPKFSENFKIVITGWTKINFKVTFRWCYQYVKLCVSEWAMEALQKVLHFGHWPNKGRRIIQNNINSGHYVLPAMPKGSAGTLLGPIVAAIW